MTFQELEGLRNKWGMDEAAMGKMLGLEAAGSYTALQSAVPAEVASHAQTLDIVRNINKGVFNNIIARRAK